MIEYNYSYGNKIALGLEIKRMKTKQIEKKNKWINK